MQTNNILYLLILLLSFSACRKDSHQVFENEENLTGEVFRQSNVSGIVINTEGQAIEGAKVTLGDQQTTTNDEGVFNFFDAAVSSKGSLVEVEKLNYFSSYRFVYNEPGIASYMDIKMVPKKEVARYDNDEGKILGFDQKAFLQFLPNTIAYTDGSAYTGQVVVYAHHFDPTNDETIQTMPGDLRAINAEESERQLGTFGMFAVELETPAGIPLQIAPTSKVNMSFLVGESFMPLLQNEWTPMWHFDKLTGFWKEEGQAYLDGDILSAQVGHFSFWNCDIDFPVAEIKGRVVNDEGIPVANKRISIKVSETLLSGTGYTNNQGVFEGKVPANVPLSLHIEECDEEVVMEDLGSLAEGFTDLGDVLKPSGIKERSISGKMLGCMKQGLEDAYGLLKIGSRVELLLPNADGSFNHVYSICDESSVSLSLFDPINNQYREALDIPIEIPHTELSEIDICSELVEFVRYSFNNGFDNIIVDAEVVIVDEKYLYIHAENESIDQMITVLFKLDESGNNREWMHVKGINENGEPKYDESIDIVFMLENSGGFWGQGDTIEGSFNTGDPGSVFGWVSGEFTFKIDQVVQSGTISGNVWNDIDEDGIRDDDELPISGIQMFVNDFSGGSPMLYFNEVINGQSGDDGYYEWTGLKPGNSYEITRFNNSFYDITQAGQGNDPTKDCDFYEGDDNQYSTGLFFINDGDHIEHIDLGLIVENTNCNYTVQNCSPDAELTFNVNGGVSPFTVNLSNGEELSGDPVIFKNLENGSYQYTIKDATGVLLCEDIALVNNNRNTIRGNVWQDIEGGTPDVWDPAIEFTGTTPFEIEIADLDGTPVDTFSTYWDTNYYQFDEGPEGTYRLRPLLSDNYELVLKDVGDDDFDSDIDPISGYSEPFTFDSCDGEIFIGIGIKEK